MSKVKGNVKMFDNKGFLTPEAIGLINPSTSPLTTITTTKYQAMEQMQVFLPSTQLVNIGRGVDSINVTVLNFVLNPGDVLTLSASTLLTLMPL